MTATAPTPVLGGAARLLLPDPPLVDPAAGIVLRPWSGSAADAAALAATWADPAVAAACGVPDDVSPAAAGRWIDGDADRRATGRSLDLVVAPVDAGVAVLGEVGLRTVDRARRRAEISWWIAAEHRGRGLATAAVALLAGWALSPAGGFDQIWARIDPTNRASAAVAERAGFRDLGEAGGTAVWSRTRALGARRGHGAGRVPAALSAVVAVRDASSGAARDRWREGGNGAATLPS